MTISVTTAATPVGAPIIDQPATIDALARAHASTIPPGRAPVGITVPRIETNQTRLQFSTRNNGTEFIFNTGTLALSLSQEIHLSRELSACARNIWHQHELKHVRDYERLMAQLERELRANQDFQRILVSPTVWRPRSRFSQTQTEIREIVSSVFQRLTRAAAARTDSPQEYQHVEQQIRTRCGGP